MILLDTDICAAALRRHPKVMSRLLQHTGRVYLPFVVSAELYFGVEKMAQKGQNIDRLRQRVNDFHDAVDGVLGVNEEMLRCYARLRARLASRGQTIGASDNWIAAQALAEQAVLVTNNIREFARVPDLRLEHWLHE
jgi:tRNA(fMet)-specific endonuclease VapC